MYLAWLPVVVTTFLAILWHVHRSVRRQQARRLLKTVITCAELSGVVHWLHGDTLRDWFLRNDCAATEQHLALLVLAEPAEPHWAALRRHLAAEDLVVDSPDLLRLVGAVLHRGGVRLVLHPQRATNDGLYVSPHRFPSDSIPIWMVGATQAHRWPRGDAFVRTPVFTSLAVTWYGAPRQ